MPTSQCPFAYDQCSAAGPAQNPANPDFLKSIGVSEPWIGNAYRCVHCSGYWSYESDGTKRRRGYVENGRWMPVP
jgi:hypothetical protein